MEDGKNTLFSGGRFVVDDRKEAAGVTVCLQGLNTYIISIVCNRCGNADTHYEFSSTPLSSVLVCMTKSQRPNNSKKIRMGRDHDRMDAGWIYKVPHLAVRTNALLPRIRS
jgi:hypothetical protein